MEPVGPNEMCKEGVSDLMKNLLPERYLYKLISHHVNEYTENTISCDLEFKLSHPYYFQQKPYELVSIKTSFPTPCLLLLVVLFYNRIKTFPLIYSINKLIVKTQRNSTQLNSKATSVGV